MTEVECPIEGCGYEGTVSEVEGHISGSTDGEHTGSGGWEFREELTEAAEEQIETHLSEVEETGESAAVGLLAATAALVIIVVMES